MKDQNKPNRNFNLMNENFTEGFWNADNAPVFFKKKKHLVRAGTASSLKPNETFFVELWGGEYTGRCFLMKAIHRREKEGLIDCIWLSKNGKFFRNICGRALFSDIPEGTQVYKAKKEEKKRPRDGGKEDVETPKKLPRYLFQKKKEAFPSMKKVLETASSESKTELEV